VRTVPAEEIENSFTWKGCILNKEEHQRKSKPQFVLTLCLPEWRDAPGRIFPNQRPHWGSMSVMEMFQHLAHSFKNTAAIFVLKISQSPRYA
jgi:hypothetical protein